MVELLISIAIIGIVFSIAIVNYRGSSGRSAEIRSVQIIAQAIREAQSMALGGEDINCTGPPDDKPCKYGIYAELASPDRITIFGDGRNGDPKNDNYNIGEQIKTYQLEENVLITQLLVRNAPKDHIRILFEPPDPIITFYPPPGGNVRIVITGGRSITVEAGGSVDIN